MEHKSFKEMRKAQGTSLSFAADYLGVSEQTMRNKEAGKTEFTLKEARKLAKLYNVSLDDVID